MSYKNKSTILITHTPPVLGAGGRLGEICCINYSIWYEKINLALFLDFQENGML
jgi:hypothetical protein